MREPGVRLPPPQRGGTTVPTEEAALAALKRYRAHPTEEDERTVHAWINAAKDDPDEYARRVRLTAPR
ncbi:MAG: hypothetical protein Q8R35_00335 [bacterium]|nr:hypothetical protein [bacterium]